MSLLAAFTIKASIPTYITRTVDFVPYPSKSIYKVKHENRIILGAINGTEKVVSKAEALLGTAINWK